MEQNIKKAVEQFETLIRSQLERVENMKRQDDFVDYKSLDKLIIGVCGGDGIGPVITDESARVLKYLLADEVSAGKV
ncbi:MAG TPA: isocitrate dehydrogenase, partial [Ruminococcaceae bacterium]|nr:isocitrate dehydrogenase [Oscillospiraceae bacterium]